MSTEVDDKFDDKLMALAAELPKELSPERDLWPEIRQSIEPATRGSRSTWQGVWAQAAAVVLLIGGSSGLTYLAVKDDGIADVPSAMTEAQIFGELEPVSGDFGATYTLGNEYIDARGQLEGSLEQKLDSLTPEARAEVIRNLNTIRLAIKEMNTSLAAQPDNVLLQELLLSAYHEEINLMKKVDGIANSAMRRDDI